MLTLSLFLTDYLLIGFFSPSWGVFPFFFPRAAGLDPRLIRCGALKRLATAIDLNSYPALMQGSKTENFTF
jgi:hypothetical protein